jgi:hypothetical protein
VPFVIIPEVSPPHVSGLFMKKIALLTNVQGCCCAVLGRIVTQLYAFLLSHKTELTFIGSNRDFELRRWASISSPTQLSVRGRPVSGRQGFLCFCSHAIPIIIRILPVLQGLNVKSLDTPLDLPRVTFRYSWSRQGTGLYRQ